MKVWAMPVGQDVTATMRGTDAFAPPTAAQSRIRIGQNRLQRQASMAARIDLRIASPHRAR
jgi:hypothetical protein